MIRSLLLVVILLTVKIGYAQDVEYVISKEVSEYVGKSYVTSNSVTLKPGFQFSSLIPNRFRTTSFSITVQGVTPPVPVANTITKPSFIETQIIRVSGVKTTVDLVGLTSDQKTVSRRYIDGLGRTLQELYLDAGQGNNKDIVRITDYDEAGRNSTVYLPYATNTQAQFQNNAILDQAAFYSPSNASGKYAKDSAPYTRRIYDNSPMQRLLQEGGFGANWQPAAGKMRQLSIRPNIADDQVRLFNADGTSQDFYPAGSLSVSEETDEEGEKNYVYTDKNGKILLKRQFTDQTIQGVYYQFKDTYYVYNNSGMVTMVIPPKVVNDLKSNNWNLSSTNTLNNIYAFVYDDEGNVIKKKTPAAAWIYIVYDKLNRPVLLQNAKLRAVNKWYFTKYDIINRPVMEGLFQDNTHISYDDMKAQVDSFNYLDKSVLSHEERGSTIEGYTNVTFPTAINSSSLLSLYYYDNYDIDNDGTDNFGYINQGLGTDEPVQASVNGKLSVIRNRIVGTLNWMDQSLFYSVEGRLIQQQHNNAINLQAKDATTMVYNFDGTLKKKVTKNTTTTEQKTTEAYAYDNVLRVKQATHQVNAGAIVTLADYNYNEIGQLTDKNLNKNSGGDYLQSVDYRYNIRGWLTDINNSTLTADGYNEESNDVFGMSLTYEGQAGIGNVAKYNGLISGVKWKMRMANHDFDNIERSYVYNYDKLGQLQDAIFKSRQGDAWTGMVDAFSEKEIKYDLNGNITALKRYMWNVQTQTSQEIDRLTYSYDTQHNDQLMQVTDELGATGNFGFKGGSSDSKQYIFDDDGNLITDKNKGITYEYNELGKLKRLSYIADPSKYITFDYNSAGERINKSVYQNSVLLKKQDYIGSFLYENNVLISISHNEGRVRVSDQNVKYEYFIRDQLNNVRVSFEQGVNGQAEVHQESSYYAFGMQHAPISKPGNPNTTLFNGGSQWLADFDNDPDLYNTPGRQYDPILGRFNGVDPMAAEYGSFSVYQFVFNNPISLSDPSGEDPVDELKKIWRGIKSAPADGFGPYGGTWSVTDGYHAFASMDEAFQAGVNYNNIFSSWQFTASGSEKGAIKSYREVTGSDFKPNGILLNEVNIVGKTGKFGNNQTDKKPGDIPERLGKGADGTGLASDFHNVSFTAVKLITKDGSKALKMVLRSGTVIGAIAGGVPAIYNIAKDIRNGGITSTQAQDWINFGLAAGGIAVEFLGVGEAWDIVGAGITGVTAVVDLKNAFSNK